MVKIAWLGQGRGFSQLRVEGILFFPSKTAVVALLGWARMELQAGFPALRHSER